METINKKKKIKENEKSFLDYRIPNSILLGFIILVFIFFIVIQEKGYIINVVPATGSMRPSIDFDCIILMKRVDVNDIITQNELKVGDVIGYRYKNMYALHRIIDICQRDVHSYYSNGTEGSFEWIDGVIIKGDHNIPLDVNGDCVPRWAVISKLMGKFCLWSGRIYIKEINRDKK